MVEIGVPFSDPMADGVTIQRASFAALQGGSRCRGCSQALQSMQPPAQAPVLLMSYLNPLLAFGLETLPEAAAQAGVCGLHRAGPAVRGKRRRARRARPRRHRAGADGHAGHAGAAAAGCCARRSQGFVYAVTMTGTTGKSVAVPDEVLDYLDRVRAVSPVPVCAGFGIRNAEQVARMQGHVDGVVVGSALVEVLERGEDPAEFLRGLKA